jgi:hypothetical protein
MIRVSNTLELVNQRVIAHKSADFASDCLENIYACRHLLHFDLNSAPINISFLGPARNRDKVRQHKKDKDNTAHFLHFRVRNKLEPIRDPLSAESWNLAQDHTPPAFQS